MGKKADPTARLAALVAARKVIKPGEVLSAIPMADACGLSWVRLREIVNGDPSFPVRKRGGNGVEWEFDGRAALDHMIVKAKATQVRRGRVAQRLTELAGLSAAADQDGGFVDVADLQKLVAIQRDVQREKVAQGALVDADEMASAVIGYNDTITTAMLDSAQRADPTGQWPSDMRAAWEGAVRDVLVAAQDAADKWIGKVRERQASDATALVRPPRGGSRSAGARPVLR